MKIRFRRKKLPEWLVLFILAMPFAFAFLMDLLRLPSVVKYTLDVAWLLLLFYMVANRTSLPNAQAKALLKISGVFFLTTLVGFLANYQSIFYYFWGIRNNIRFFVFFFACICCLNWRSINNYLNFFDSLFWINLPVTLFQYFVMGKTQDYLGGVFGTEKGCNGYMNILLLIIVAKSILYYMNRQESLRMCLAKCATALLIAVLSELKMFFLEFIVIVLMIMVMTRFSFRKFGLTALCLAGVIIGAQAVSILFPDFANWFSLEGILKSAASDAGYTAQNDINRLTAVTYALTRFMPSLFTKLFGLGLGNCDYASFSFLTSPFYETYGRTNYVWFSSSFLVLETGLIGLALYVGFFALLYLAADKREKTDRANRIYCQMAKIMAVMSVVMIVYNAAMRTEAAYLVYFILSLPFLRGSERQNINYTLGEA